MKLAYQSTAYIDLRTLRQVFKRENIFHCEVTQIVKTHPIKPTAQLLKEAAITQAALSFCLSARASPRLTQCSFINKELESKGLHNRHLGVSQRRLEVAQCCYSTSKTKDTICWLTGRSVRLPLTERLLLAWPQFATTPQRGQEEKASQIITRG